MTFATEIVTTVARFDELVAQAPELVVADVETRGKVPGKANAELLGVAIAFRDLKGSPITFYLPFWEWNVESQTLHPRGEAGIVSRVKFFLQERRLIGHNIEFDRAWLNHFTGALTKWSADTRLMWHQADDKDTLHGFSLKTGQVEILGWPDSNEKELEEAVEARGGSLSDGDHYLAPLDVLGRYACLDAVSTLLLFEHFKSFFDKYDYWDFHQWVIDYGKILADATSEGIAVDVEKLLTEREALVVKREEAAKSIREVCVNEIAEMEQEWREEKAESYKKSSARENFLGNPDKWKRFNPNSSQQRVKLFHEVLGLPVVERSKLTKAPKSDRSAIAQLAHPAAKAFVTHSEYEAVTKLANGYVECLVDNRLHCPYNLAGTVSGRLGGYKPYALNMPFSEEGLMSSFVLEPGYVGVHADLAAVEPCLNAGYSEDPTLLKVHRDGLGDVYLDFALVAFPENKELHALYNPNVQCTEEIKKRFKRERNVCKIVHLAVGYTGTYRTVYRALRKAGFECTESFAARLVNLYWRKFEAVALFNKRLQVLHSRHGMLRNVMGRIIQVPEKKAKDTMNRFIQSSGHDCLMFWVHEINRRQQLEPHLGMRPVLPDIHDSTSWKVREEHYERAVGIFKESLGELNSRLALPVTLRAEIRPFRTLAGLKGDER